MRPTHFPSRHLLLACFALLAASVARAQQDPNIDGGLKPYGSFHGGDIDSVILTNGKLNLHSPLLSYPQRGGKLHFGFFINYPNHNFSWKKVCAGYPTVCKTIWFYSGGGVEILPDFVTTVTGGLNQTTGVTTYTATTPDGSAHQLNNTSDGFVSLDATGFHYDPNSLVLLDHEGVRTFGSSPSTGSWVPAKIEDSNGNYFTSTLNSTYLITSWTDTLGRIISTPPSEYGGGGSTSTTDFTGCTGPLTTTAAYLWSLPGASGGMMTFKVCVANPQVNFPTSGCSTTANCYPVNTHPPAIQSIVLPNNTAWTFKYNGTGDLSEIDFPTGGSISYGWTASSFCGSNANSSTQYRSVTTRSVDSKDGTGPHSWTYGGYALFLNTIPSPVTVTDPLGNQTVHTFSNFGNCDGYETETQIYQNINGTQTILKTVNTDYASSISPFNPNPAINVVPIRVTTTWPSGLVAKTEKTYDSGTPLTGYSINALYGDVVEDRTYDFGSNAPGSLLKRVNTSYLAFRNSSYLANNLLTLPASITTYDGAGTQVAASTFGYDQFALGSSGISTQRDSSSPAGSYRGNQTSVSRWLNTTNSFITSTTTMFDTGTVPNATDPLSHATTRAYSASFAGAYATTVTNALNQSANHNYDFNTGLLTSTTDPNNVTTSFSYDNMGRVSQVTHPDGGTEIISHQETTFPFSATLTKQINSAQSEITTNVFDGLGRLTQSQLTSDPQGTVYTDTTYDTLGRVATVSNPYRKGTDLTTTAGTTTYAYDALGRKISETYPDNSVLTTAYCGPSTLVTDPTGKWRRSRVDGLGRLVEVDEPNSPTATVASTGCPGTGEPIWVTTYSYDTLGNLTSVVQNGSHQRNFTYDSLSRLLTATNPETGTITYAYNNDGALISKTDARNITTTYSPSESPIDVLHRVTKITYSNGDPSIMYAYDQAACLGLSACQNIGHRTSMTDAAGSEAWSYQVDATNHRSVHVDQRTTVSGSNNITKISTYYLDLAGNVTQAVYPTGRTVNYTYDSANRPSSAADGSNGITYAAGPDTSPGGTCLADVTCYTPQGTLYALSIGETTSFTGLNLTHIYNNRLQPQEFKASSSGGNAIDISYSFVDPVSGKNAGHVYGITNNLDATRSQTFTYDQLNRIASAQTTSTYSTSPAHCWGETYSVDAWGNLQSIAATTNSNYTGCSQESGFSKTADGNNHFSGFSYDVSGNTTSDGISSYTWDGESQLKSAGGVNYFYDGDGRRVYKSNGKLYWYGSGGDILAETDASGNTVNEYIFFGGKRIAMLPVGGNPIYYVEDLLGTSRVLTTNTGVVCYDADFYPYGGERSYTNTCSQNNYKFEGKERDTETGNDDFGARYYSNRFGRWLSADWSAVPAPVPYANLINPQTLNLYAMVADDPESFADLDGHLTMNSGSGPCNGENESNCNSPAPPPAPQGQNQTAQPAQQRKLKINIIFSSSLSDKQRALAMGLLAHAEVGLARAGIKTKETGSQTLDFDQIKKSKGMDKGALNVVFGTNEDFSGVASSSGPNGDFRASFINVAKDGDNEAIVQFEVVQALTSRSRLPVVGLIQNAFKDGFYTNWITAALDGTPRSIRAANILTLGGVSEMKSNAVKYSDPDQ